MKTARLWKLARFLRELPPRKFYISLVVSKTDAKRECGTVCCGMGWTPRVFPDLVKWTAGGHSIELIDEPGDPYFCSFVDLAAELFDISYREAQRLFNSGYELPWLGGHSLKDDATPVELADSIRLFVQWKKEWHWL